jgi:hypothetical protein
MNQLLLRIEQTFDGLKHWHEGVGLSKALA